MLENAPDSYQFGPFRFEPRDRRLLRDGQPLELTPKTARLLLALLEADGHVVTREELDQRVWPDAEVGLGSLPFQVHLLRRALGDDSKGQHYIVTAPRHGYRVGVPIQKIAEPKPSGVETAPPPGKLTTPAAPGSLPKRRWHTWLGWAVSTAVLAMTLVAGTAAIWRPRASSRVVRYTQVSHDGLAKRDFLRVDTSNVYYRDLPDTALFAVPIRGGESTKLEPPDRNLRLADFSPARSEYLAISVASDERLRELWATPKGSGPPRRLGTARCNEATWSPDATRIACATDTALLALDTDGATVQVLARPATGTPYSPQWSPDGGRLRFSIGAAANRVVTHTLWEVRRDGTELHQLLSAWEKSPGICCGRWSPDGREFVFESKDNDRRGLWIVREDSDQSGTAPSRLTNGPLQFSNPVWTTDGKQVLALGAHERGELVRYNSGLRAFAPYLGGLSATGVTFSRDGNWVAYSSFPDKALWRARADGSDKFQLTAPMGVQEASWSPDGRQIAFRTETGALPTNLYVIPRDGGTPRRLPSPNASFGMVTWSPDGAQLATSDVPGVFGKPEGTEAIRVYDFERDSWSALPGSDGLWTARWSPDGRYIAALTIRGQRLRLFDTQARAWRTLDADHINSPTWSRDGRYIYYDTEGGIYSLRRVRIDDGHVEVLTSLASFSRAAYWWSGLSLDDAPIVLRDIGAVEIYALEIERN